VKVASVLSGFIAGTGYEADAVNGCYTVRIVFKKDGKAYDYKRVTYEDVCGLMQGLGKYYSSVFKHKYDGEPVKNWRYDTGNQGPSTATGM
jgi:hypothetical protein